MHLKDLLPVGGEHHSWNRRVTHTEYRTARGTDMWGRTIPVDEVICHTQYVCQTCGAVKAEGECACDVEKGELCPPRLKLLEQERERNPAE